ncbi:hypothetical protein [Mesorhizobium sp. WSM2561]|uniref:hypothetical protein n=1 Tax=Mesorhizobium sp. WSM2561 TaxID=1040985 RepID=UPI000481A848|nr:hypothetical protein [Mesorhizobium sp. WSM2561]
MFNQILTAFQGFFSRSFWFGSFLPVAVAAAFHLVIAANPFPALVPLRTWLDAGLSDTATMFTIVIAALVVLAYALTPFIPLIRGILDGHLLPDWLHDHLRKRRIPQWRTANEKLEAATSDYGLFTLISTVEIPKFWAAELTGDALGNARDQPTIATALETIENMQNEMRLTRLPKQETARIAAAALIDALTKNASNLPPVHPDRANASALARAKSTLISLIDEAMAESAYRIARVASRYHRIDLLPTRVGDARRFAERYSDDTYQVEFNYLWPRIQMLLKDDDAFSVRLSDAQSQVNFSVLALALALTVPLVWLPILLYTSNTPWLFLAIGFLSPPTAFFLYELIVQSQSVFGEIVRVAVDKYRLPVLTEIMRQPLPATLAAERILWERLKRAGEPGNQVDYTLTHEMKQ